MSAEVPAWHGDVPLLRHAWTSPPVIWYRPSIRRLVWRLWAEACLWVAVGAACLGGLRVARVDFGSTWLPLYAVGLACVTAGPWRLLAGLQRAVRIERVLSVHPEGLRWEDGPIVAHYRWVEIDAITVDEGRVAIVGGHDRLTLPAEMDGISAADLARALADMRRKALLGLPVVLAVLPDRT